MRLLTGINTVAVAMGLLGLVFGWGWLKSWAARNTIGEWVSGSFACVFIGLVVFWYAY